MFQNLTNALENGKFKKKTMRQIKQRKQGLFLDAI